MAWKELTLFLVTAGFISGAEMRGENERIAAWQKTKALKYCFGEDLTTALAARLRAAEAKCVTAGNMPALKLPKYDVTHQVLDKLLKEAERQKLDKILKLYEHTWPSQPQPGSSVPAPIPLYPSILYQPLPSKYGPPPLNKPPTAEEDRFKLFSLLHTISSLTKIDLTGINELLGMESGGDSMPPPTELPGMVTVGHSMPPGDDMIPIDSDTGVDQSGETNPRLRRNVRMYRGAADFFTTPQPVGLEQPLSQVKDEATGNPATINYNSPQPVVKTGKGLAASLAQKVQEQREEELTEIGKAYCLLQDFGVIDEHMNLDVEGIIKVWRTLNVGDEWLKNEMEKAHRGCYAIAEALPREVLSQSLYGDQVKRLDTYLECVKGAEIKVCMDQDAKNVLETNFGSLEDLVKIAKMTEEELLALVPLLFENDMTFFSALFGYKVKL